MDDKGSRGGSAPTLHDVAARAGVSVATVSRALNGLSVSDASLERVRAAAADLGYVANATARGLRNVRTMTMGAVFRRLESTTQLELLDALTATVEAEGYSLFVSTARGNDAHYDTLMRRMLERRVDAVFCVHPRGEAPSLKLYASARIPVMALLGRSTAFGTAPVVATSFRAAADAAVARLVELGHRKIAKIASAQGPGALAAVGAACKAAGLAFEMHMPPAAGFDPGAFLIANAEAAEPATAVIALYDHASRLREAAVALGLRVPGDLSICAIHHNAGADTVRGRSMSAIHVDFGRIGKTAAEDMLEWLGGSAPAERSKVEVATWVERATTGPPLARS